MKYAIAEIGPTGTIHITAERYDTKEQILANWKALGMGIKPMHTAQPNNLPKNTLYDSRFLVGTSWSESNEYLIVTFTSISFERTGLVAMKAIDAFWSVVAKEFPEFTTGDLPFNINFDFDEIALDAVKSWIKYQENQK